MKILIITALLLTGSPLRADEDSLQLTGFTNVLVLLCKDQNNQEQCINRTLDCITNLEINEAVRCVNKTIVNK